MKSIRIFLYAVPFFVLFAFLAFWIAESRGFYRDLDFFTFWLGGRMVASGQDVYNPALWEGNHSVYGSTWLENPFFVYPLYTAVFFIPFGVLPIEYASSIWVFLSLVMIVLGIFISLSTWKNIIWKKMIFPIVITTILFRPALLTILHGQIDSFLFLVLAVTTYLLAKEKNTSAHLCLPLFLLKPNLGVPIIGFYVLWLVINSKWKDIFRIIGISSFFIIIPLFFDRSWIIKFVYSGLYKGQDVNLYPTLRGVAGVACNGQLGCSTVLWVVLSVLFVVFVILQMTRKKKDLSHEKVLLLSVILTILIIPYLRAYDLIFLTFPVLKILDSYAEAGWKFLKIYTTYFLWVILTIGFIFVALRVNHDIWSVLLTIIVFSVYCLKFLFSGLKDKLVFEDGSS